MLDKKLLEILVCPICKGHLEYKAKAAELWCGLQGFPTLLLGESIGRHRSAQSGEEHAGV